MNVGFLVLSFPPVMILDSSLWIPKHYIYMSDRMCNNVTHYTVYKIFNLWGVRVLFYICVVGGGDGPLWSF